MRALLIVLVISVALLSPAAARSEVDVDYALDGSLTGASFAGGILINAFWPVDRAHTWHRQLLPFDNRVKANFSLQADLVSDVTLVTTALIPPIALMSSDFRTSGDSILVYGEALGVSFLLNNLVKYLVQRPRPYTYNRDPQVEEFSREQGKDSHLSFYSGHAALSFTSAVAGSYLFGLSNDHSGARAAIWGMELALAAATANLRVRAGKHFYSDVIVGAIVGAGLGFAVTYLHENPDQRYEPTAEEWGAMGGGLVAGILISQLIPFKEKKGPYEEKWEEKLFSGRTLIPVALKDGAGFMISGAF